MVTGDHPPTPQVGCSSKRGTSEVTFFSGCCRFVNCFYLVLLVVSTTKVDHTFLKMTDMQLQMPVSPKMVAVFHKLSQMV